MAISSPLGQYNYIKSSNTFLPCIILFLSKLYAVGHCIMENNLKYYNEYTSVSKSFKNDAGISNYSMLFCINLLNVANTISKIVIIISSTLYAIHQFTLYILMYIACTDNDNDNDNDNRFIKHKCSNELL